MGKPLQFTDIAKSMGLLSMKNKVAVITGSTRCTGRAIALSLAAQGASVYINGRGKTGVEECVSEFKSKDFDVEGYAGDVSDEKFVKQFVDYVFKKRGHLDILINSAGISEVRPLEEISSEAWDKFIGNNLTSVFLMCREAAPLMKQQRGGKIITITSLAASMGRTGGAHYAASKSGIIGLTKTIAKELGPFNVQVNAIAPGVVNTEMPRRNSENHQSFFYALKRGSPLRRITQPEDIANAALFLSSPLSDAITGQILTVDCGYSLNYFGI